MLTVTDLNLSDRRKSGLYEVELLHAAADDLKRSFQDMSYAEVLERLPLSQLVSPGIRTVPAMKMKKLFREMEYTDLDQVIDYYLITEYRSWKSRKAYLDAYDPTVFPVTGELLYRYDYGDGWEVRISTEAAYSMAGEVWSDSRGNQEDSLSEALSGVLARSRPVCIAKDGPQLVDDVGGLQGFCHMLQVIHLPEADSSGQGREMLAWAHAMGWTGRKISPGQAL